MSIEGAQELYLKVIWEVHFARLTSNDVTFLGEEGIEYYGDSHILEANKNA